jgi:TolB-like protein
MKQTPGSVALSITIIGLCLLVLSGPGSQSRSWAADSPKTRLAVAGFEKRGEELPIPDLEQIVSNWLIAFLVNTKSLDVVERQALEKVLQEQSLGQSGILDSESAAKVGQLLGVDVLVTGSLTYLNDTLEITARMIDSTNGSILGAASVSSDEEDEIRSSVERLAELIQAKLSPAAGDEGILLFESFDHDRDWTKYWSLDVEEGAKEADIDATEISQEDGVLRISGSYGRDDENRVFWIFPTTWQRYQAIEAKVRLHDIQGGMAMCLDMVWGEEERWTSLCPYVRKDYSDISIEMEGEDEPFTFEFDIRPDRWYVMRLEYRDGVFSYYWDDRELKRLTIDPAIDASDEMSVDVAFALEKTRSFSIEIDQITLR